MATRVLELIDESTNPGQPTGDTATLNEDGSVSFQGNGVRNIFASYLLDHSPRRVFNELSGWSNRYVTLQERE